MGYDFLLVLIAKRGLVNKAFAESNQKYSARITFFAEGSVNSTVLKVLGLDRSSKEVAIVPVNKDDLDEAFDFFERELKLTEKNTGIAFSVPLKDLHIFSNHSSDAKKTTVDFPFHCITAIVDKGKSSRCINAALKAHASGGTILQGHGAGIPKDFYFPIAIEPQKDIVLIVTEEPKLKQIEQAIIKDLQLTKPGMGVLFVLPVNKAIGIRTSASSTDHIATDHTIEGLKNGNI
ncbi:MAG: P-II family nitrogen regulator [Spirochaetaceae bacterium]|nr:P-II family nitrogen regulator [Spirochaetaceae bacterium]